MSIKPKTAVVVGSGFGGLALAVRLQAAGIATTVLERRDKPGGRAYVYEDEGFVFDAGPTVMTDPSALEEIFAAAGRKLADYVDLMPVDPFYRLCWEDGTSFDYNGDQEAIDRQIAAFNPDDVAGYRDFLAYSRDVFDEGYVRLGAHPFLHFRDMVRVGPKLAGLAAWQSVYQRVARHIADEKLRQVFSFHSLLVGGNPFSTPSIYALIHALERKWGIWFPRGGTGALIEGLVRLFRDIGGRIELSCDVEKLDVTDGRITAALCRDGRRFAADLVASNADVVHSYGDLLAHTRRGAREAKRLSAKRFSMSLFVVYFGLNTDRHRLAHHTVCFGTRYRDLIDEIFRGPNLPHDFSLYLHSPGATDPSLAPAGQSAHYVLAPVPHLGNANIDWNAEAPAYRDRILAYLEAHYMPDLRRDLVTSRVFTPLDFRDTLNAHLGSAFSLDPVLTQSAWFRPHNRDRVLENFYLVGAGTHPGAGVPGVVASAKATAALMLADAGLA
ncbi:phytoene desaturase [Pararhizobium mangrovi]|uniref:Phytoene dehydrogenase n=1 Tax=Pararhizobium mangrovi TaxID=2590452 RepID=A0A506UHX5_9HYPH|nr:phytoene desaturase [Pararhizobium mangrovi]TPW32924.1 phytoene desaturase [Pararhizobium mangrovi]